MLKKLIAASLLFMGFAFYAQAQLSSVSGKIKDGSLKNLHLATVTIHNSKDSSIIKIDITDTAGKFEIQNVLTGNYFIAITCVGFKKNTSASFYVQKGEAYFLPDVILYQDGTELTEINVEANKPMIEVTPDKTVFNIEGSINAAGSNAFELLQKSPGVIVDKDDNILLKGKNGVRIYIDGKISQLQTKDLADYLRSINSADIEAIEMISNPSAKYDASGNAGIINLRLKKNKNFGTNGSVTSGLAIAKSIKNNNSFNLNYRNKNVNLFGNFSDYFGRTENLFTLYRKQNDSIFDQHTVSKNKRETENFKAGMDYFINPNNTAGFIVNGNFNNSTQFNDGNTFIIPVNTGVPLKILYATNYLPTIRYNLNYNVNFRHYKKGGSELNLDGDIGTFNQKTTSYQPNVYRDAVTGILLQEKNYRNNTPIEINVKTFKVDYEKIIKNGKLGFGGKYSRVKTKNTFDFYDVVTGGDRLDSARSNKFNFSEKIDAVYVTYSKTISNKWQLQSGLRMENTFSEGNLTCFFPVLNANVKRSYTDLFPSGTLTYNLNEKNFFNLSYGRRIDRPGYDDLNPFENKIDELTYQKGNPFLKPQYSNVFELTHSFLSRFNTTLSYSHIKDFRAQIVDTSDRNHTFITPKNLASQDIYNINFSAPFLIEKWWNVFLNVNGYHSAYKANFGQGKKVDINLNAFNLSLQQTFSFEKKVTLEILGYYNSPGIWRGTFRSYAIGNLDVGFQKVFDKGRASIKLSNTDVFNTVRLTGVSEYSGVYTKFSGKGESNQFRVNFTYRFGSSAVNAARQRKLGLEEENKRINGAGGL